MSAPTKHDPLTVVAIAVAAYFLNSFIHESLGHAATCLSLGAQLKLLTSVSVECEHEGSNGVTIAVAAAGTIANLVAGSLAWSLGKQVRGRTSWLYFLWLVSFIGFSSAGGYMLFGSLFLFGDYEVLKLLPGTSFWRMGIGALGLALLIFNVFLHGRRLRHLVRLDPERSANLLRLTLLPYLAGSLAATLCSLLNPSGFVLVLISAMASTLFGTSPMVNVPQVVGRGPIDSPGVELLTRSNAWLVAAACVLPVWVWLGHGIHFRGA